MGFTQRSWGAEVSRPDNFPAAKDRVSRAIATARPSAGSHILTRRVTQVPSTHSTWKQQIVVQWVWMMLDLNEHEGFQVQMAEFLGDLKVPWFRARTTLAVSKQAKHLTTYFRNDENRCNMLGYQNIVTETNFTGELSSLGLQDKPKEKQICATMRHRISHFNFPSMSHSYPMNFPFSMDWLKGKITGNPLLEIHGKIHGKSCRFTQPMTWTLQFPRCPSHPPAPSDPASEAFFQSHPGSAREGPGFSTPGPWWEANVSHETS